MGKEQRKGNVRKIHRSIFKLQVPGKGTHPTLKDFTSALTAYQIIPPGNLLITKSGF